MGQCIQNNCVQMKSQYWLEKSQYNRLMVLHPSVDPIKTHTIS